MQFTKSQISMAQCGKTVPTSHGALSHANNVFILQSPTIRALSATPSDNLKGTIALLEFIRTNPVPSAVAADFILLGAITKALIQ